MNETEFLSVMTRERERIPVTAVVPSELIAEARRVRRRRRGGVAGLVLAVALTGGLAVALSPNADDEPTPVETFVPPTGARYVGIGGAVIAVPSGWKQSEIECRQGPLRPSVVFDLELWQLCKDAAWDYAPSAQLIDPTTVEGRRIAELAAEPGKIGDLQVLRSRVTRPTPAVPIHHDSRGMMTGGDHAVPAVGVLSVPENGFLVRVEGRSVAQVRRILASVRAVPDGYVVLPPTVYADAAKARARLQQLGATVTEDPLPSLYAPGRVLAASPAPGSPVPRGTAVRLTVSTGPDRPVITTRELQRNGVLVRRTTEHPAYSRAKLVKKYPLVRKDGLVVQALLRRVTVPDYGRLLPDGSVDPKIDDRLVWLLLTAESPGFISGPIGVEHAPVGFARSATLIDASTGKWLMAQSF
jgi:hypothetical protein